MNGEKNTREVAALDQPHNEYVHILVQLGLFGFAFFLWLLFQQSHQSFRLPLFEKQCAQALILCFIVTALDTSLLFYATSMTDYVFFSALFFANGLRPQHLT
jgi:O-antigen ligase